MHQEKAISDRLIQAIIDSSSKKMPLKSKLERYFLLFEDHFKLIW